MTRSTPAALGPTARVRRLNWAKLSLALQVLAVLVAFLVLWEVLSRTEVIDPRIFSSPTLIWDMWWVLLDRGLIWPHLWETTRHLLWAFVLFTVVAGVLGVVLGMRQYTFEVFYSPIAIFFAFPKVTLYPIFLIAFGLGAQSKILFGALFGFFPLVMNTMVGVREVRRLHLDLMRSIGAGPLFKFFRLLLPATLPSFATGLRIGFVYAGIGILLAEMFAAVRGLGNRIIAAGYQGTLDQFWVYVVLSSLLLLAGAGFFRILELRLSRWRP
ncbi:MAG TPA: ABC transporter permease subunit [Egibacteraceae bacterium]|nr:ABC transporter permease subunit [Egibacteraceae bacterium]